MEGGVHIGVGDMVLGKYRVERIIGHGGMGFIVAARHQVLDELFAIKLMLPSFAADLEAQERFLREARAAARLKGDHVAKVQDVGCLPDGTSYMVMEYLEGEDLKKIVKKRGPLPIQRAVEYTLQTCAALREAHALGIVHRDVKPANLMLVPRPDGAPRVKVIDFGISKHTAAVAEGLTSNNWTGGSPLYMPPEQIRSARSVDVRADVWSTGVVLYELLTGSTPFHATSIPAVMQRVLHDEPVPPGRLREGLPRALGEVVMRCLAKRPEDRFQTIDELAEALADAAPGDAVSSGAVPLARPSLASLPYDVSVLAGLPAVMTAHAGQRPSTTGLNFGHMASLPPGARSAAGQRSRRAFQAAACAAVIMVVGSCGGVLWLRLRPEMASAEEAPWQGETSPRAVAEVPPPRPAAPVPSVTAVLLVSPAASVQVPTGTATAAPTFAPKAAPGEKPMGKNAHSASKKDQSRLSDTASAASASARRKPEPLY